MWLLVVLNRVEKSKAKSINFKGEITNNQDAITKQIPIFNNQTPNKAALFGYLNLVIGYYLVIVSW